MTPTATMTADVQRVSAAPVRPADERMRALYQAHSRSLMHHFLTWTHGDRQAAEDLMQETMLRAWRNLDTLNPNPLILRPWLVTVGRRIAIDAVRARSARPPETEPEPLERMAVAGEPFEQILDRDLLREALAGLSAGHRAVLSHVYLMDQTVPQAARELGIPEGTAKSRIHHALRALRNALKDARPTAERTTPRSALA